MIEPDTTEHRLGLAKQLFLANLRRPLYPACIYADPEGSWHTLYGKAGVGDTAWQDLVATLLQLGWQPPHAPTQDGP